MAIKVKKNSFTKAFTKTKLGYLLDQEISKGEFEWTYHHEPKQDDTAWHPSGHCIPSPYELYHIAKGDIEVFSGPKPYKVFQVGHFWHQYLQEVCVRAGFCDKENVERRGSKVWGEYNYYWGGSGDGISLPSPYHWVTGSADIAPCNIPGHGEYLIDYKTMSSFIFKDSLPSESNSEKWECQLNIYMDFFDLEKALIVGINKDGAHDLKEWEYTRNQPLIDALYYKWKMVSKCLDEKIPPPEDEVVHLPLNGVNA